ncbi:DUF559 domain-containing protein [Sphingosinicella sp. YJ22]|uniref:endonuclease domain-containing protein n=1 Tax=Sphingosinicella sp. YJ22 TaxID=1104780 RepID=UPI00140739C7|nr:DUF559 domain-containing protein [Sphingosinicella sp. YJ22]
MTEAELLDRARHMRNNPTEFEKRLWRHLSGNQMGHKFRRQHVIFPYIVDLFCPAKGLAVEVDGETHAHERDRRRDARLAELGFRTIRVTNDDVRDNMDGVLLAILRVVRHMPDRWPGPTPTPPLKGRG